jgi:large subunit ribosomal protein L18Ae
MELLALVHLQISEKNPTYIKNYGFWIKYNSRSGTHNMYREYRDVSVNGAVTSLCKFFTLSNL